MHFILRGECGICQGRRFPLTLLSLVLILSGLHAEQGSEQEQEREQENGKAN